MPRISKAVLTDLSTADLKSLLAARKKIDVLEKRKQELAKELASVDKELDKLLSGLVGAPARAGSRTRAAARKPARKKAPARSKTAKGKPTLEEVIARLIRKKGAPVPFKELSAAITRSKLFTTKSKNFDNVLRRTLSTSKKIKRVGRGLYDVA